MADTAPLVANNLPHNVVAHIEAAKTSLSHLANVYLVTEVAGQSAATVEAKQRDLQRFLTFYQQLYKHDRPDEWFVSVTKAFLGEMVIVRQDVREALAAHDVHGDTIREAVLLIETRFVEH